MHAHVRRRAWMLHVPQSLHAGATPSCRLIQDHESAGRHSRRRPAETASASPPQSSTSSSACDRRRTISGYNIGSRIPAAVASKFQTIIPRTIFPRDRIQCIGTARAGFVMFFIETKLPLLRGGYTKMYWSRPRSGNILKLSVFESSARTSSGASHNDCADVSGRGDARQFPLTSFSWFRAHHFRQCICLVMAAVSSAGAACAARQDISSVHLSE